MTTATDIASYINARANTPYMDNRKLQKLVYFSQAWALGWTGRPLIDATFEAWPDGPVDRPLWVNQRYYRIPPYAGQLDERQTEIVESVLAHYLSMSSAELVALSHEDVWSEARGNLPPTTPSREQLDNELLRKHYVRRAIAGDGPSWAPGNAKAKRADVVATARVISDRWKDGLDLLAAK